MNNTWRWKRNERTFGYEEFADVAKMCKAACVATGVDISMEHDSAEPAIFTKDTIRFNGRGDDHGETFIVHRIETDVEAFCRTEQKPYDKCVAACLTILKDNLKFDVYKMQG